MAQPNVIRPCAVCGTFYPADPKELAQQVTELLNAVEPEKIAGRVRGLIQPHAGYIYSGFTAAHGIAVLKNTSFETVVIVAPSHREYFDGVSVFAGDAYCTPMGSISVNDTLRNTLLNECSIVTSSQRGHGKEHAIEVQLPFLQHMLKKFDILPIVIGDQNREYCFELGRALAAVLQGRDVLLVASTDLSHYYPSETADRLDSVMIENIRQFNYERLMTDLELRSTEACGGGPTVAVMAALHQLGVRNMKILHHCNSGDITGDHHSVVGYLSALAYS